MSTFTEFLNSFDPDSKGKQFEHFVKWFLQNDPQWSTQVDKVWLWDEYPERWGRDCGVDLIFKHKNGDVWAVQTKCYSPEYSITKTDVDKFLSESNRQGIDKRLLIASTDQISSNAKQVCDAQEKSVTHFLFSDFDKSAIEYPKNLSELKTAKRKEHPSPRPHQVEAIDAVEQGFKENDRGQLIMACGTGKTFTTLWIKERIVANTTLVLVPSLSLLSQTLREWTFASKTPFDVLCVCSDQSVSRRGNEDEIILSAKELSFPVTSDPQEISSFLRSKSNKVIFSTYQSSPLIAESQNNPDVPMFDLVLADEAHRCSGKVESAFSTALDNQQIRAKKRLFATATPRTYSVSLKKKASERGVNITGMDDEAVFGKPFYTLTFGEAINRNLLTDFQIVIIGVNDPMIAECIEKRELVQTNSGHIIDASSLASQIGLIKAIKDYDLKRVISFHSRVKNAEIFALEIKNSNDFMSEEYRPNNSIWTDFVSGQMTSHQRRLKLEQLKELITYDRGLLSNAKCLSEGVDLPSLDGIAFIDPKGSKVDIIQAVGRAIRLSNEKKIGTVVLPVFIKDDESAEASIKASKFKPIWDVLNALKAHDDVFSLELDQLRTDLGRKKSLSKTDKGLSKIIFDLPSSVDQSFSDSLQTYLLEKITSPWSFYYGLLEAYVEEEGHARVPGPYKTEDGSPLGTWVLTQRHNYKKNKLTDDRVKKLEALPKWSWYLSTDEWEDGFLYLVKYVKREGHSRVPRDFKENDGYNLGLWVGHLRQIKKKGGLTSKQIKRLEALPNWSWDPHADSWNKGFLHLVKYVKQKSHARVPDKFKTEDQYGLGRWVGHQRETKERLTSEQIKKLEALPKWTWGGHQGHKTTPQTWDKRFSQLVQFARENGHARVKQGYQIKDGFNLGQWVNKQKVEKTRLTPDKIKKLEALPKWTWQDDVSRWDDNYSRLVQFARENGHSRVSQKFKTEDGSPLGTWILTQRQNYNNVKSSRHKKLTSEQIKKLEELPKWSWDPAIDKWEECFSCLLEFVDREGHARVKGGYQTKDRFNLGTWVKTQKRNKTSLTPDKIKKLEALEGWVWKIKNVRP